MKATKAIKLLEKKAKKFKGDEQITNEYMKVLLQCEKYNIELDNSFLDGYEALMKESKHGK